MKRLVTLILFGTLSVALSGCGLNVLPASPSPTTVAPEPVSPAKASLAATPSSSATPIPKPTARSVVVWTDYSSGLQSEIDAYTSTKDCRGIQSFFGMTVATEASMLASKGHGNSAVTAYINEALTIAGCN
jgi:hypothetical protein